MKKLRRVVIREEFVAICGDGLKPPSEDDKKKASPGNDRKASLLNQIFYWEERRRDFKEFLEEETKIFAGTIKVDKSQPEYGWIYKACSEMAEEMMWTISTSTVRRHLDFLVRKKFLFERNNPRDMWDQTLQYRLNTQQIVKALRKKGYALPGYTEKIVSDAKEKKEKKPVATEGEVVDFLKWWKEKTGQEKKLVPSFERLYWSCIKKHGKEKVMKAFQSYADSDWHEMRDQQGLSSWVIEKLLLDRGGEIDNWANMKAKHDAASKPYVPPDMSGEQIGEDELYG